MREDQFVLHFETAPNRYPDTVLAGRALIEWVALVQAAVMAVDPAERLVIEIVGVREGSSRFQQLLKWAEDQTANVRQAWEAYPNLKSIIAGSAHAFLTSTVAAGVTLVMQPAEQTVRLSDQDRVLLAAKDKVFASAPARDASKRFYTTLSQEPAITGVGVGNNWSAKPTLIIPRSEFAERSGLWDAQEEIGPTQVRRAVWEVVLLRPNLVSKPQPWQFSRDGLKFSAQMADAIFLAALSEGRVPLNMQEGLVMRVEVEYEEMLVGQVWDTNVKSRRVIHVLSPTPTAKLSPYDR